MTQKTEDALWVVSYLVLMAIIVVSCSLALSCIIR